MRERGDSVKQAIDQIQNEFETDLKKAVSLKELEELERKEGKAHINDD